MDLTRYTGITNTLSLCAGTQQFGGFTIKMSGFDEVAAAGQGVQVNQSIFAVFHFVLYGRVLVQGTPLREKFVTAMETGPEALTKVLFGECRVGAKEQWPAVVRVNVGHRLFKPLRLRGKNSAFSTAVAVMDADGRSDVELTAQFLDPRLYAVRRAQLTGQFRKFILRLPGNGIGNDDNVLRNIVLRWGTVV